jgi:hypothetical protein
MKKWKSYEDVAAYLLNQFATEFELQTVGGKQVIVGTCTNWEIDAKGFCHDGSSFVIIECKRYTTSRPSQSNVAALAYEIRDTGARGGIFVTPLGLQKGAARLAAAENIISVQLSADSTRYEHVLQFLDRIKVGCQDSITLRTSLEIQLQDNDGNVVHHERVE